MAEESMPPSAVGLLGGIVFGSGVGATVGVLAGVDFGQTIAYGTGGGLLVGTLAGRLAVANRGERNLATRIVGGTGVLGFLVGVLVGIVAAWGWDGSLVAGLAVGGAAGLTHGLLLGGVLTQTIGNSVRSTPESGA